MAPTRLSLSTDTHSTLRGAGTGSSQPMAAPGPAVRREHLVGVARAVRDGARRDGVRRAGGHPLDVARQRLDHGPVARPSVGREVVGDVHLLGARPRPPAVARPTPPGRAGGTTGRPCDSSRERSDAASQARRAGPAPAHSTGSITNSPRTGPLSAAARSAGWSRSRRSRRNHMIEAMLPTLRGGPDGPVRPATGTFGSSGPRLAFGHATAIRDPGPQPAVESVGDDAARPPAVATRVPSSPGRGGGGGGHRRAWCSATRSRSIRRTPPGSTSARCCSPPCGRWEPSSPVPCTSAGSAGPRSLT